MKIFKPLFATVLGSVIFSAISAGQAPRARITRAIDESDTVAISGNIHPALAAATASSAVADSTPLEHMILYLKGDAGQEAELEQLIAEQANPQSPLYHHYLSPAEYGAQFGAAPSDIATVINWLQQHGFTVEQTPAGNRSIIFSGTAGEVAEAFNTEIRQYNVGGNLHYANASDPRIPAALAGTVGGIVKLHDFRHGHSITAAKSVSAAQFAHPQYSSGSSHYLAPADYGTIYDINSLYSASINGTGQTIAIIARSDIYMSDVESFRNAFGLKANDPQFVFTNSDPGIQDGDTTETTLDTEWAGAIAPNATVKVIISASTSTADGIDLSSLYAVNNNAAPIISLSYGSCEASMGSSELAFYNSLWQQAVAQGQTVLVSSGDSGAAGCDYGSRAVSGLGVNGLCSTPYSTCVGGTEFADTTNPGQYWHPGNSSTYGSAISYIPETVWNESGLVSGGSGLWAGGGGVSITYAKPGWQTGPGVPADGKRDVPDVSMAAAGHDGYLIWQDGQVYTVGGTSCAAPSFAGLMALVDQKTNSRQGLVNSTLYALAGKQASGGPAVFHDITAGNNSVPGLTGFSAAAGYDRASGLGSVDAALLVNNWSASSSASASLTLSASTTSVSVLAGKTGTVTLTTSAVAINAAVTLSVSGAPIGLTASLGSSTIASPGSGSVVLNLAALSTVTPGTYSLSVKATGGSQTATLAISVVIPTPTFTLSPASSSLTAIAGNSIQLTVATTPANGFSSTVSLSATNLPTGVTAAFSPSTISGASGGSSSVTLAVAKTVNAGAYSFKISASGGGVTQTISVSLAVQVPASCTLVANPTSVTVIIGQTASVQVSCGSVKGTFSGALSLSVSGTSASVTGKTTSSTMPAGSSTTLSITASGNATAGNYSVSITASGSGFTQTLAVPVSVPAPTFSLATSANSVTVQIGSQAQLTVTATPQNGFSSSISYSVSGLPAGVTESISNGSMNFSAGGSAKAGSYTLTITATGGGVTKTASVSLLVAAHSTFTWPIRR